MSDYANASVNAALGSVGNHWVGGLATTPYGNPGHVSFQRHDGAAQVSITAALTPEAALKLDAFLRDLIAADGPGLAAWREKLQAEAVAQQRSAYEKALAEQAHFRGDLAFTQ